MLHLEIQDYQHFVGRSQIEEAFNRAAASATKSPRMTKKAQNQRNSIKSEGFPALADIPAAPVGPFGIPEAVQRFFEVSHPSER
jgi:hypothetical protein